MNKQKGLNSQEVEERKKKGLINIQSNVASKSYKEIFIGNLFTFFNLLNIALALCIVFVHSYRNMLFMGVVFWNALIGCIQEIRAKHVLDKMVLLMEHKVSVWRDNKKVIVSDQEIVQDDIIEFYAGEQIPVDARILEGMGEAEESMLTGESNPVDKKEGDLLLSGSYLISGQVTAQAVAVGENNYANRIVKQAKKMKKIKSEIKDSLDRIVKILAMIVLPLGAMMFYKQYDVLNLPIKDAVVKSVASVISMIPDGLVLLASVVMAISVVKLARKRTVVQELYSIENLARVDVLCLDKTGTITEGKIEYVTEISCATEKWQEMLEAYLTAMSGDNATSLALKEVYSEKRNINTVHKIPFSSKRKWGAITFEGKGTYFLGAPEATLEQTDYPWKQQMDAFVQDGKRVLLFGKASQLDAEKKEIKGIEPLAVLVLTDCIRKNAKETLDYFQQQGVAIKLISGDNPKTVMEIGKQVGLKDAEKYIDTRNLSVEELKNAAQEYTIFGRVSPEQKCDLVKSLQEQGHSVAMTGDGVNDVLALKEADCSIVMGSGCDVARKTAKVVLLDSDFSMMPQILAEGRRAINNLERSATLFLTKTTFATILLILFLIIKISYPLQPIQLTLISSTTIGIPAFLLALEANYALVQGKFLPKVFSRAVPTGCMAVLNIGIVVASTEWFEIPGNLVSTMVTVAVAIANLYLVYHLCQPWNKKRICMFAGILVAFFCAMSYAKGIFMFRDIPRMGHFILIGIAGMDFLLYHVYQYIQRKIKGRKKS